MEKVDEKRQTWMRKRSVFYVLLIVVFVVLLTTVIVYFKLRSFSNDDVCFTKECVRSSVYFMEILNTSANPCDNFYNFVCGNYRGISVVQSVYNLVNVKLRNLVIGPTKKEDSRSVTLQKKYYQSCMNLKAIEDDENRTLKKMFVKLGGWPVLEGDNWNETKFDWGQIVDKCKDLGLYYDWFISIENENVGDVHDKLYINVPDNVNQINDTNSKKYLELITNVVILLALPNSTVNLSRNVNNIMEFELKLSKIIGESPKHQVEYTAKHVKKKFPNFPWASIFKNLVMNETNRIGFNVNEYLSKLQELLDETPKRIQADYIFWKLTESFSTFLSSDIRKGFEGYSKVTDAYTYQKDRHESCYRLTSSVFAYVSEAEYVRKYAADRKIVRGLVDEIRSVLRGHLKNAEWMADLDKDKAVRKLDRMTIVIGGPEEMYDEKEFDRFLGVDQIDILSLNNTVEIVCEVDRTRDLYNLNFDKPKMTFEKAKFYQGVANFEFLKYNPDENILFLPAVVMDSLFYTRERSNFLNYGAIGAVIGHELAHGFGIMGQMSKNNEEQLWTNYTANNFFNKAQCLLGKCNEIGTENNYNVSCEKTFEENFADYAGINLSYEAYIEMSKKRKVEGRLPGLPLKPDQLFWVMYASIMCNNRIYTNIQELSHMLPYQRILGSFRNSKHFAEDFNCPAGSNMNPREKCSVL